MQDLVGVTGQICQSKATFFPLKRGKYKQLDAVEFKVTVDPDIDKWLSASP